MKSDHSSLMFTVYGRKADGTFTEEHGLVGLSERREAQLGLLKLIFGTSLASLVISILALLFRH